MKFSLVDQAYVCPITNKLLDTTFKGFTPYLPTRIDFSELTDEQRKSLLAEPIAMPEGWRFDSSQEDAIAGLTKIRDQVSKDPRIVELGARNHGTDTYDRTVEGGYHY